MIAAICELRECRVGAERDARVRGAGLQQQAVKISAVDECIRITETLTKRLADGNARDLLGGYAVHHHEIVRENRDLVNGVAQAERFEHPKAVGADLDPRADLVEGGRTFDHERTAADVGQRARGGETADAAADDQHIGAANAAHAATTSIASVPRPSTEAAMRLPGTIGPTPSGVPVKITSPGSSV